MIRIVKMTFKQEAIPQFEETFAQYKNQIRAVDGCTHLELLQDINHPQIFMTYSYWDHPDQLEAYRHSDLFKEVWAKTKIHFDARPQAWSVAQKVVLD